MTDMHLFDPDVYGPGRKPRTRLAPEPSAVEPHTEPWCQLRRIDGLHPFFHLISARTDTSNNIALCGVQGTKVPNLDVSQMVRCPTCQVSMELMLAP